jgi:hypothetical protein
VLYEQVGNSFHPGSTAGPSLGRQMGQHFRPVVINCSDRFFCLLAEQDGCSLRLSPQPDDDRAALEGSAPPGAME